MTDREYVETISDAIITFAASQGTRSVAFEVSLAINYASFVLEIGRFRMMRIRPFVYFTS